MRVNQSGNNSQTAEVAGRVKVTHAGGAKKAENASNASEAQAKASVNESGDAKAEISSKAKEFAKAKAAASEAPDVREEKIAALKARIASGGYKVDADAIADRMVDEHLKMGIG